MMSNYRRSKPCPAALPRSEGKLVSGKPIAKIAELRNLGKVSQAWLNDAGIYTEADLRAIGAEEAYIRVWLRGHRPSLNLLYALYASIHNMKWNEIPPDVKARLKSAVEGVVESVHKRR